MQKFAIGLAKALGVTDETTIKAIKAAALLHDTGKLAVPEHILNKPGKLTPLEFEQMKLHVDVGADILSSIDFPYPVVPIVRAHHESWDGSGYPRGLKGEEIPIGARILSVVDCYDALTSDRPYRAALSDAEAMKIVVERRGKMYDPDVVDTFVKVYREIAAEVMEPVPHQDALSQDRPRDRGAAAAAGDAVYRGSCGRAGRPAGHRQPVAHAWRRSDVRRRRRAGDGAPVADLAGHDLCLLHS